MSKNKLSWIIADQQNYLDNCVGRQDSKSQRKYSINSVIRYIAIALIAVLALPAASAQGFSMFGYGVSNVKFFLVNAAVIFFVLFILQAFLVPGKEGKEKTSMWVIVLFAALLISYLYGGEGYIWQTGFIGQFFATYTWYMVLGNAAIIAIVLYFILGWMDIAKKLGSPEGKTGYGILLFIVSSLFAIKLGNTWIWQQSTISQLIDYFFGQYGILTTNQNRIFIFIGTSVLFAVFFDYVGLGKENRKLNYMLAVIFAANLVSGPNPYTYSDIKPMVLIIGTWILGGNLSGQFTGNPKWKIAGYAIAFLLMMWATSSVETAVTPEGKAAVSANGGGVTGWIWGFFSMLFSSKGIWILAAIVLFLLFAISRGENQALIRDIRERYSRLIWTKLKESADSGLLRWIPFIGGGWHKRETEKGMLPKIIRENIDIFHALMGYMKRIFIFLSKWKQVRDASAVITTAYGGLGNYKNEPVLINQIKAFRTGGEIYNLDSSGNKIESNEIQGGLFGSYEELIKLINATMEITSQQLTEAAQGKLTGMKPEAAAKRAESLKSLATQIGIYTGNIKTYFSELNNRVEIYGNNHVIKAWMYLVLDQVNPSGDRWPHSYFFVPKGTAIIDESGGEYTTEDELTEVNMFGQLMEDIFDNMDQFAGPKDPYKRPRKVKDTRKIMAHPDPYLVTKSVDNEWMGFMKDLTYGDYHPYSRSWPDYEKFLNEDDRSKFNDDELVKESAHLPSKKDATNPAFDREALKNPGQFIYWGRRRYNDDLTGIEEKNPYPTLTAYGMTMYLLELTEKDLTDKAEAHKYLSLFLGHSGEWTELPSEAKKVVTLMNKVAKKGEH